GGLPPRYLPDGGTSHYGSPSRHLASGVDLFLQRLCTHGRLAGVQPGVALDVHAGERDVRCALFAQGLQRPLSQASDGLEQFAVAFTKVTGQAMDWTPACAGVTSYRPPLSRGQAAAGIQDFLVNSSATRSRTPRPAAQEQE